MRGGRKVSAICVGGCLLLAGTVGCASRGDRSQQLFAMEAALSSRYVVDGPSISSYALPVGTVKSTITEIPADSAQTITLISASLIPLRGFRVPLLLSAGVIAGRCPQSEVVLPPAKGHPSTVLVNGRKYQPLPLRGYTMQIGAGCVPQLIYMVRVTRAGQYATGGLRVLVRAHGRTRTMFAYGGADIWYYGGGPLPSPRQVTDGLRAAFAAQVASYRSNSR
jgi:hypothetical protein